MKSVPWSYEVPKGSQRLSDVSGTYFLNQCSYGLFTDHVESWTRSAIGFLPIGYLPVSLWFSSEIKEIQKKQQI